MNEGLGIPFRRVNRFRLGADPEFLFLERFGGSYVSANALGLRTGLAFGADLSGRQAELRLEPSHYALKVVASTLATLRWLALAHPEVANFTWRAGAYAGRDGLGGHLHFARKRPTSPRPGLPASTFAEVGALDLLARALQQLYPQVELNSRRYLGYGGESDVRFQSHGYEYRTLPSWLGSPYLMHLHLTLGKLTVFEPKLAAHYLLSCQGLEANLRGLLNVYKTRDLDASLALACLNRWGLPKTSQDCFKPAWGIASSPSPSPLQLNPRVMVFPGTIPPSGEAVTEVYTHLLQGTTLGWCWPSVTWTPYTCPPGFIPCLASQDTTHQANLGELLWNLCLPANMQLRVNARADVEGFGVTSALVKSLPINWRHLATKALGFQPDIYPSNNPQILFQGSNKNIYEGAQRALTCGAFPIYKISEAPEAHARWQQAFRAKRRQQYKILYGGPLACVE